MSLRVLAVSGSLLIGAAPPTLAQTEGNFDVWQCNGSGNGRDDGGVLVLDLNVGSGVCRGLDIKSADGRVAITAEQASSEQGLGLESHTWQLVGARISLDEAEISAGRAELVFEANELVSADVRDQVELSDFIEERNTDFRATTDHLIFDSANDLLRIPGQAAFRMGEESFTGCDLTYNPVQRKLSVGSMDKDCTSELRFVPQSRDTEPDDQSRSP